MRFGFGLVFGLLGCVFLVLLVLLLGSFGLLFGLLLGYFWGLGDMLRLLLRFVGILWLLRNALIFGCICPVLVFKSSFVGFLQNQSRAIRRRHVPYRVSGRRFRGSAAQLAKLAISEPKAYRLRRSVASSSSFGCSMFRAIGSGVGLRQPSPGCSECASQPGLKKDPVRKAFPTARIEKHQTVLKAVASSHSGSRDRCVSRSCGTTPWQGVPMVYNPLTWVVSSLHSPGSPKVCGNHYSFTELPTFTLSPDELFASRLSSFRMAVCVTESCRPDMYTSALRRSHQAFVRLR